MPLHCVTIHPFDPWGNKIGGIENFIRAMFRCSPLDIKHSLIGVSEDVASRPLHQWQSISYENTPIQFLPIMMDTAPNKRSFIPLFMRFSWLLRKIQLPDDAGIIVFHRIEPPFMTKINGIKSILLIHGNPQDITGQYSEVKWKHVPWLYRKTEKKVVNKVERIHVVSQCGLQYLQQQYPERSDRFCFQPTGFNEQTFRIQNHKEIVHQKYKLNPVSKYILIAGRLEAQKNPLLAIETFLHLRKTQKAHLLIAGEGSLLEAMQERCLTSTHGKDVHFLGRLDSQSLAELMNCCLIFLMTSHFEGMPIAALEALACGLPVVTMDVGEVQLFIKDGVNGKIVHQQNPISLANALSHILNNPEYYSRSVCAETVQAFRYTAVMEQLYQQFNTYVKCHD